ncbi:MAG: metalloregulator ArsR/SmtB family transcription factor [Fimbriimonas sp.]|nr:metalloregulator ArsR/SmtB family transcription factor [Fimbriimonas sp.]
MIHVYEELAETSRRQILAELLHGPRNVSEIVAATAMKQPNVSSHLARMRGKGILRATKNGREVYYSIANPEVETVIAAALARRIKSTDISFEEAVVLYGNAAVQGDETTCSETLDKLFAANASIVDIYQKLIVPVMRNVGAWYGEQTIDAAQEHMASAITERMMARIVQVFATSKQTDKVAVLGCGPNSWHTIGLRMVSDYLRVRGWKTLFLGANVPQSCFLSQVAQHRPNMVLLSCKAEDGLESGLSLIRSLGETRCKENCFAIGVGGCCAGRHRQEFMAAGADFICTDIVTFAEEIAPVIEKKGKLPR